jgi:radical SAM-linked protein
VIQRGYELGCRFDGWTEHLKFDRWMRAFEEMGIDPVEIANRSRGLDDPLPWDHIDIGVSKKFLQREYKKAMEVRGTPDCHVGPCSACGEICMPNWPTWAEKVGITVSGSKCQVPGSERQVPTGGFLVPSAKFRVEDPLGSAPNPEPGTQNPEPRTSLQRIRFVFQKTGVLRFLSHLEVVKAFSRALRRAGIPVAYSQGYNPQPKLAFALALPVGVEGWQELADIELRVAVTPGDLVARVNRHLAAELRLLRAWEVPITAPSLTSMVRETLYEVSLSLNGSAPEIRATLASRSLCQQWLNRPTIPVSVQRKEKMVDVDVRPHIKELLALEEGEGTLRFRLRLVTGQGASVRPQAILASLLKDTLNGQSGGWETKLRVARTALILDREGDSLSGPRPSAFKNPPASGESDLAVNEARDHR